ncbi:MAG: hypothetical protein ACOC1K_06315 [Nanoarchaeota archaeon]
MDFLINDTLNKIKNNCELAALAEAEGEEIEQYEEKINNLFKYTSDVETEFVEGIMGTDLV